MSLYQPPHFTVSDPATLLEVMRAYPLATLVSAAAGELHFTHLPLEAEAGAGGLALIGHLARANPHWRQWRDGAAVTAIFHGPDAYVSPRWYRVREAVPTWNYVVVHAHGRVAVAHDDETKERVLKALIGRHDAPYRAQWDDLPEAYREKMKRGIVACRIDVERLEGKFKLGQNRSAEDRAGVHEGLAAGDPRARALAAWMRRLGLAG